jgi:IS4 transposase
MMTGGVRSSGWALLTHERERVAFASRPDPLIESVLVAHKARFDGAAEIARER